MIQNRGSCFMKQIQGVSLSMGRAVSILQRSRYTRHPDAWSVIDYPTPFPTSMQGIQQLRRKSLLLCYSTCIPHVSFPNQTREGLNLIGYNNSRGNTKIFRGEGRSQCRSICSSSTAKKGCGGGAGNTPCCCCLFKGCTL